MSVNKSNSSITLLLYNVNLIAAKSVDGRVNDLVPSSAVIGLDSPRQRPRSSLDAGCRTICPDSNVGVE